MQGLAQLGQGVGYAREEKAVIVHIERQRQAVAFKGAWEKIQIRGQVFVFVKPCPRDDTTTIVEHVEERQELGAFAEPSVR